MMRIVGMMSGTSADGIDAALVEIEGAPPAIEVKLIRHETIAYDPALRSEIFASFRPETSGVDRLNRLNIALGEALAAAALQVVRSAGFTPDQVDLVASHGQAIWYELPGVLTLGEPAVVTERTGITTIAHFRSRDLATGGRGAPLVSYLDWLLFRHPSQARAIQNIGGIGNLTALPPLNANSSQAPITFDTGPGNMIIDYCVNRATDGAQEYDDRGQMAARGSVHNGLLVELMATPYIQQRPPKTTGRELFGAQFGAGVWERGQALKLRPEDIIATATAFTARSIAYAIRHYIPYPIHELYIAGGGAFNTTLWHSIQAALPDVKVAPHDALGIPPDAKECILFALLGYETWHARPGTLPVFTGASHPVILGNLTPGRLWPPPAQT